ncbi:flagellar hook-associated protein 3 [Aliikangiella marina]|uniref:Flagellar hook-associated protein 3 n=1 Tax=Aliikangiella marina TaxID=1712262 RepID=A0A545TDL9_9GAMM|nr:flagellar hook-associated protein FlgL [Aliikangiella marina]TQV75312.1 flagellar hook-associated protein 3 [Aliikangiella marina]
MRVSFQQMTNAGVRELLLRQSEVQRTQLQLATQKRVINPSDDPVAATSISFLKAEIEQLEQFNRNADAALSSNQLEETALGTVTNILFRIQELTVSAGNGVYAGSQLEAIKIELEERLEEVLGQANTQDAKGDYVFSGSIVKSQPYTVDALGNVVYNGDQNQRNLRISSGTSVAISDSGFEVFSNVKNGNGTFYTTGDITNAGSGVITRGGYNGASPFLAEPYDITFALNAGQLEYTVTGRTSGTVEAGPAVYQDGADINFQGIQINISGTPQAGDLFTVEPSQSEDVFTTIQNLITALDGFVESDKGRADLRNVLESSQATLERHIDNIDGVRAKVGARLNAIDTEYGSNLSLLVTSKSSLSDVEDLDVVEASTRLSEQLIVLEAAQASFIRVRDLNLFNFLR